MVDKQKYLDVIDQNASVFTDVSDKIWEYAELSLMEYKSAKLYCEVLEKEGFTVETPVAGIETAFKAIYGSGHPVIGMLAEYDALTGLSQEGGATERKEVVPNGCGHGCGHNMLGAGSMAAAFAVKKYLEETKTPGTVIFYGCPGEEGGASKAFMARDNIWPELDAALTWHPGSVNQVTSGTCNTLNAAGVPARKVARVSQAHPNILDMIASGSIDLIINTPTKGRKHDTDGFKIRRAAVEHSVACVTAIDTAHAILTVREQGRSADLRPIDITEI